MAYNHTRAAGILADGNFTKATPATIRRKLINVPARIASSARKIRLHLPESWPWKTPWENLYTAASRVKPVQPGETGSTQQHKAWNTNSSRASHWRCQKSANQ